MSNVQVIKGKEINYPVSRKMSSDPFASYYADGILEPPYDLDWLSQLPEHSNILSQCVEAMEVNIDGFGFTLEPAFDFEAENEDARNERKTIEHFFEFCNPELPYSQLRRRVRRDLEVLGNAYWEVIRDGKGDIVWLEHIEGHTMRLTALDKDYTDVEYIIRDDASSELQRYPSKKRFRRFIQIRDGQKVYFKEFGDPRLISARTGRAEDDGTCATEIIHFKLYCPYSPYGVPRWIGNWLAVTGSRQAEEVNHEYFENNTVPPLALLVSGTLDDKAVEKIEDFINDEMRGRKSFNKILIIEAAPYGEALPGTPIFVGLTSEYTRATARESREVAEEQVFGPERADHDFVINRLLFPAMGVKFWKYKSLPPKVNDFEIMSNVLDTFSKCGLTVRELRAEISRLLNHPLEVIDEDSGWLDLPLQIYLSKLQYGGSNNLVPDEENADKETLFLQALTNIEKNISSE